MNNKFDELTKSLAQSVTRRGALKKFSLGLAAMALACFGLADKAEAGTRKTCKGDRDCGQNKVCAFVGPDAGVCLTPCNSVAD
jgi:hypothetical protein